MAAIVSLIWGGRETEYFLREDWTTQISLIRHDKSDFRRAHVSAQRTPTPQN
jgi:hypothetical protein